jgi:hypothetical protein
VFDVLLKRLGSKDCLKKPSSVMYLPDMPNLFQTGDSFAHERNLLCAVLDFLDRNSGAVPRVNYALVISHQNEHAAIVEDGPIFPNHGVYGVLKAAVEVGEVQALTKDYSVKSLVILKSERVVNNVKWRRRVFELAEDRTAVNIV